MKIGNIKNDIAIKVKLLAHFSNKQYRYNLNKQNFGLLKRYFDK